MESTNRQRLIEQGFIQDFPVAKRAHNRYRKDTELTLEQKENLTKIHGISIFTTKDNITGKKRSMQERDVLAVLRKRHKKYMFTDVQITNKLN